MAAARRWRRRRRADGQLWTLAQNATKGARCAGAAIHEQETAADRGDRRASGPGAEVVAAPTSGDARLATLRELHGRPSAGDPLRPQRPVPGDQRRGGSRLARPGDPSDARSWRCADAANRRSSRCATGRARARLHRQEGPEARARQARHLRGRAAHRVRQPRHLPALGVLHRPAERRCSTPTGRS